MNNYVSVRLANTATMTKRGGALGQALHDTRAKAPGYIQDGACMYWLGSDVLKGATPRTTPPTRAEIDDYLKSLTDKQRYYYENYKRGKNGHTQKLQKGAQMYLSGILTFSPEHMSEVMNTPDLRQRIGGKCRDFIQALCDRLNTTPAWTAIHNDETTLHLQFGLCNIGRDGKAVQRRINMSKSPDKLCTPQQLQDIAAEVFKELGFQRGQAGSTAKHQDVRKSHAIAQAKMAAEGQQLANAIAGAQDTLEQLLAKEHALQVEIKSLRRTRDELARQDKEERARQTEEQQRLREELKKLHEELKTLTTTKAQEEDERRRRVDVAMEHIAATGLAAIQLRRQPRFSHQWIVEPQIFNITAPEGRNQVRELLAAGAFENSWHINAAGPQPVVCLDDLDMAGIAQIRNDGLRPSAIVETSPGNYQVWLRFNHMGGGAKAVIYGATWNAAADYLRQKYQGDPGAAGVRHPFRLAGFPRSDNPDWIARLVSTDDTPNDYMLIADAVSAHAPQYKARRQALAAYKETHERDHGESDDIDIPDWFISKWLTRKANYMKRMKQKHSESEVDYALTKDLIRSSKTPETKLKTAEYAYAMLLREAQARQKASDYAARTVSAALADLDGPSL